MNLLKIFLVFLLLLCLAPMPYGYYQLVRFVAMMAFAIMAFGIMTRKKCHCLLSLALSHYCSSLL